MADEHAIVRARKKFVTLKRYEKRLQDRLSMIDWEYDVLLPQVKELELALTAGNAPVIELTDGTR